MAKLFIHPVKVTIYKPLITQLHFQPTPNAITVTDLRVQASIEKTNGSEPNKCDVTLTNLSAGTRAELAKKPITVQIEAGYDGILYHLYTGDLRDARSDRKDSDWETKLQLGEADRVYRYAHVNRSFKKGTKAIDALHEVAKTMGLVIPADVAITADLQKQFAAGVSLFGPARDELTRLLAPYDYGWSIQNNRLQILKTDQPTADRAFVMDSSKGMIGSPEWGSSEAKKPAKLTVKSLLYPQLFPGAKMQLTAQNVKGVFKIDKVTHTVDSHGECTTACEIKPTT